MPFHPLDRYLNDSETLAPLEAQAQRLLRLQRDLVRLAPDYLTDAVRVVRFQQGKLVVGATGAVAAKLRQLAASLTSGLVNEGWNVTEIRVRIQVAVHNTCPKHRSPERTLSAGSREKIEALRRSLPDGALQQALRRLLARAHPQPEDEP